MQLTDATLSAALVVAVEQCLALAMARYGLDDGWRRRLAITTDLRGRAAGKVEVVRRRTGLESARLRLNLAAARLDWQEMVAETIPHEVAHLVVMSLPRRFGQRPHGPDWRQVCQTLGGKGAVRHSLPLHPARRTRLWRYLDSDGICHQLSSIRHQRLQQGGRYQVRTSGAWIEASGFVGPE